jgi:hypothetical protein
MTTTPCDACGAPLPTGARFCRTCGARQQQKSAVDREEAAAPDANPKPTLAGPSHFPYGRLAIVLAVGGVIAYFAIAGSDNPYDGLVTGFFAKTQYVGGAEEMTLSVTNRGKRMPNVTVDLDNNEPWVVQDVNPQATAHGGGVYSFGPLPRRGRVDITFTLVPKEPGNFTIDDTTYGELSSSGIPL